MIEFIKLLMLHQMAQWLFAILNVILSLSKQGKVMLMLMHENVTVKSDNSIFILKMNYFAPLLYLMV